MDTFEPHRRQVFEWAYRLVRNPHDAADICQDVYLRWDRATCESNGLERPVAWLRRVTVNLAIDVVRARRKETLFSPAMPVAETSAERVNRTELAATIAMGLSELTDMQRAVVVSKVFDGLTFARIADEMGLAIPTVKTHYLRALRALRPLLAPFAPDGANVMEVTS